MKLAQDDLNYLCDLAKTAALEAGSYIAAIDPDSLVIDQKDTGTSLSSQVVTQVDRHCDQLIRHRLKASCQKFSLALLSEESSAEQERQKVNRFTEDYFWCVDPLDGTLPFTEGKPGFSVSIALVSKSGDPVIGVVYDPALNALYHGILGQGAFINGQRINVSGCDTVNKTSQPLSIYADLSFKKDTKYPKLLLSLKRAAQEEGLLEIQEIYGNGAVKNACAVIVESPACYLKSPKKTEGGGQPLDLNRPDSLFMNHRGVLFCSNEKIARQIIAAC